MDHFRLGNAQHYCGVAPRFPRTQAPSCCVDRLNELALGPDGRCWLRPAERPQCAPGRYVGRCWLHHSDWSRRRRKATMSPASCRVMGQLFGCLLRYGYGSKLKHQGTAGFSPWFHLLGFQNGYPFLTHNHMFVLQLRAQVPSGRVLYGRTWVICKQ